MTRDEVNAMTNEELRIKAAELLGWRRSAIIEGIQTWQRSTHGGEGDMGWGNITSCGEGALPDYPNDIAAAWELVGRLMENDQTMYLESPNGEDGEDWVMCVFPQKGDTLVGEEIEMRGGGSAARAVTRAFILAMEGGA